MSDSEKKAALELLQVHVRARRKKKQPVTLESAAAYLCSRKPTLAEKITMKELAALISELERQAC